jgi:hypothetical protein
MNRRLKTSATSVTGMLTQKMARQPSRPATSPPSTGPSEFPSWTIIDWSPSARPRRSRGNAWVRIAAELAQIAAEPSAVTARVAIRSVGVAARLESAVPSRNTVSPPT